MRIIVTGGLGFIGSSFVNLLDNNTDFDILVVQYKPKNIIDWFKEVI